MSSKNTRQGRTQPREGEVGGGRGLEKGEKGGRNGVKERTDGWEKRWRGEKRREERGRKDEQWRCTYQAMKNSDVQTTTAVTYYNTRCTWFIGEDHFACMYYMLPNTTHPHFAHCIKANMGRGCLLKCSISLMDMPPNPLPPPPPPPLPNAPCTQSYEVDNHNDWQTSCSSFAELVLCTQETSGTCVDTKPRGLESTSTVSAWCQEMTPRMLVIWSTKPWRWPVFICLCWFAGDDQAEEEAPNST